MLNRDEAIAVAERFGVADSQVRRDWLVSHILGVLSRELAEEVVFFGGTALARSFLPDGRLSEDVDLLAVGRRTAVAAMVEDALPRGLRREYPGLRWEPPLTQVSGAQAAVLIAPDGVTIRVQLLGAEDYPAWPVARRALEQRYSDAPPARLRVPTRAGFAAWKTVAWAERRAPRDLYDLWGLARIGAIDAEAGKLFVRLGPTNRLPAEHLFAGVLDEQRWRRDLSAQTRLTVEAREALSVVERAWRAIMD